MTRFRSTHIQTRNLKQLRLRGSKGKKKNRMKNQMINVIREKEKLQKESKGNAFTTIRNKERMSLVIIPFQHGEARKPEQQTR